MKRLIQALVFLLVQLVIGEGRDSVLAPLRVSSVQLQAHRTHSLLLPSDQRELVVIAVALCLRISNSPALRAIMVLWPFRSPFIEVN